MAIVKMKRLRVIAMAACREELLGQLGQKENIAGFVQELSSAEEQYIPSFRLEGLEEI